jgi:hypothetical protein
VESPECLNCSINFIEFRFQLLYLRFQPIPALPEMVDGYDDVPVEFARGEF